MKKHILTTLCLICAVLTSAQEKQVQKDLVIHKKDGSKYYLPIEVKHTVEFWGLNEVKDNDYVKVSDVSGPLDNHSVSMTLNYLMTYDEKDCIERYSDYGIIWSTTPGVSIEKGEKAIYVDSQPTYDIDKTYHTYNFGLSDTSYDETTYYYRAYVTMYNKTYYSEEKSHTFYPHIYNYASIPDSWDFEKSAYVQPTDNAFKAAFSSATDSICSDTSLTTLKCLWCNYITEDIAKSIIPQNSEGKICYEGDLFYINEVSEDFINTVFSEGTFHRSTESINYSEKNGKPEITKNCTIDTVECNEKWGLADNTYWKAIPTTTTVQPQVGINLPHSIPGYTYSITVVFAPDTEAEADSLATRNKVRFFFFASDAEGLLGTRGESIYHPETQRVFDIDNATKCDTVIIEREVTDMQNCMIQIISNVSTSELKKGYTREIRIADIKVERRKKEAPGATTE